LVAADWDSPGLVAGAFLFVRCLLFSTSGEMVLLLPPQQARVIRWKNHKLASVRSAILALCTDLPIMTTTGCIDARIAAFMK
jgi:hypothetical protein